MTPLQNLRTAERLVAQGRYEAAIQVLEPVVARRSRATALAGAPLLLGRAYYLADHLPQAEATARTLLRRDADDAEALRLLARIMTRRGGYREAGRLLTRLDDLGVDTWADTQTPRTWARAGAGRRAA